MQLKSLRVYTALLPVLIMLVGWQPVAVNAHAPKAYVSPIAADSIAGTYELNDYEDGKGRINRLVVEHYDEDRFGVSVFGNDISTTGGKTTIVSDSAENRGFEITKEAINLLLPDSRGKSCWFGVSFADGTATIKSFGEHSFKVEFEGVYRKISPHTLTDVQAPELANRRLIEVPFAEALKYVRSEDEYYKAVRLATGERFIMRDVPVSKIKGVAGDDPRSLLLAPWLRIDPVDDQDDDHPTVELYAGRELSEKLKSVRLGQVASLRMTAVLVTFSRSSFREAYIVKVEGITKNGSVLWEEKSGEPNEVYVFVRLNEDVIPVVVPDPQAANN